MKKVQLGSTGLRIFPLIFGTLPIGPLQSALSPAEGGALIRYALERGVNMLDTAALYETYPHIRAALEGFTGEVYLASKTHAPDAAGARAHVEGALRALGIDRLDVVHLHGARLPSPFVERAEVFDELLKLREEGKIAHVGLSSHYVCALRQALTQPDVAVVHPLLNRGGMGILDGGAEQMCEAIAEVAAAGKGVYAMKALAGGNHISQALENLAWVRSRPGVAAVAVGMLSRKEIDANIALFSDQDPDHGLWSELQKQRRRLRIMDRFCKGCGACLLGCTADALRLEQGKVKVDEEACILCGYCAAACPEFIIRVI